MSNDTTLDAKKCPRCQRQDVKCYQPVGSSNIFARCEFCHLQTPAAFHYKIEAILAWNNLDYTNPTSFVEEYLRFKEALTKIVGYRKHTADEDDYQSLVSIMATAGDALNPLELVHSDL